MSVYVLTPDSDVYDRLVPVLSDDWDIFDRFRGESLAASWVPVPVRILKAEKSGDFPSLLSYVPVFGAKALQVLQPLVSGSIEALPLKCDSGDFYAINVLDLVDCLDYSRSEIEWFPSGGIMVIDRYAFKPGSVQGKNIFKVLEAPLKYVLVSDAFKTLVEENGLLGLKFEEVG